MSAYSYLYNGSDDFLWGGGFVGAVTTNPTTVGKMKVCGFISHGCANIAFKDKKKQYKDASDINLWRICYGYADALLT